jgi:glutathione S-transferase
MKLYGSLTSPFVRVVRMAALELGLGDKVVLTPTVVRPTEPNRSFGAAVNPLRRVPALETDSGESIIDSRVIVEYLNDMAGGDLVPRHGASRISCLNRQAVVAGATEALVSAMYETRLRPEDKRWPQWSADQIDKAHAALDWVEAHADEFSKHWDFAALSLVALVDYARFRFPGEDWLAGRPRLAGFLEISAKRESVAQTTPRE